MSQIVCVLLFTLFMYETKSYDVSLTYDKTLEVTDLSALDYTIWCKFQPNSFNCAGLGKPLVSRFYYDLKMKGCKAFSYGLCPTLYNNFELLKDCHETCVDVAEIRTPSNLTDNVICRLQPEFGSCDEYYPMFYFDVGERICKGFSFSSCGGNQNRFQTKEQCTSTCSKTTDF